MTQLLQEAYAELESDPEIAALLQDQINALTPVQEQASPDLETLKFQQYYRGVEVVGSIAFEHVGRRGKHVRKRLSRFALSTQPSFSAAQAVNLGRSLVGERPLIAQPQLAILPIGDLAAARLVYWLEFGAQGMAGGREVVIDAHSGAIVANVSKDLAIAPIQVFSAQNQGYVLELLGGGRRVSGCTLTDQSDGRSQKIPASQCKAIMSQPEQYVANHCQIVMQGAPLAVAPASCQPGNQADSSAANAYNNSTTVLNYYLTRHNRNSYDGNGSTVVNVVHGGIQFENAFWDTENNMMVYGDGNPADGFGDFTRALDVAGHEMTHGVTAYTAKLTGFGESGALNEANSDFFGVMIAGARDWEIGKALSSDLGHAHGVRNLANPGSMTFCAKMDPNSGRCIQERPFPSNINEMMPADNSGQTCDDTNDNCWVHENATITGHASYLVTQAIGVEKAEHLYYVTLTQDLGPGDTIRSEAQAVKDTCAQIYDGETCAAVQQAFAQVGL